MTNQEGHIKLWDELARTGERLKSTAFYRVFGENVPAPKDFCFACQESNDRGDKIGCTKCPLTPNKDGMCLRGRYDEWVFADTPAERKRLAAIIRDLPWRSNHA